MIIRVGQHIYGNLEKDVSPRNIGGFQTIARTKAILGEIESSECEKRLVYNFSDIEPVKFLFFSLSSNKYVISRLIPLPDLDRFGRKGIYLAQSFIFQLEDFQQLNCDPWAALKLLKPHFINSNLEVLNLVNQGRIDLDNLVLEVLDNSLNIQDVEITEEAQKWDTEELKKLAFAALNSTKLKAERKSVAIIGTPEQIEKTISVALSLLPNQNKLDCSFDTYSYGCNPVANYFWALGYPSIPPTSQGLIFIDAIQRNIRLSAYSSGSGYEKWLYSNLTQKDFLEITKHKALAGEMQNLLSGNKFNETLLQSASESFLRNFLELNWSFVLETVNSRLIKTLGPHLAAKVLDMEHSRCQNFDPWQLLKILMQGLDMKLLSDDLFQVYKNARLSEDELNELGIFLKTNKHDLLTIRYYFWRKNSVELLKLLDGLDERTYREIIEQLMKDNYWSLSSLMSPSRSGLLVEVFLDIANRDTHQITEVPRMVRALVMTHQENQLTTLTPLLTYLNLQQLKEIEKEGGKASQSLSKVFFQSVQKTIASKEIEEKEKRSIPGLFNKVFKKRN